MICGRNLTTLLLAAALVACSPSDVDGHLAAQGSPVLPEVTAEEMGHAVLTPGAGVYSLVSAECREQVTQSSARALEQALADFISSELVALTKAVDVDVEVQGETELRKARLVFNNGGRQVQTEIEVVEEGGYWWVDSCVLGITRSRQPGRAEAVFQFNPPPT